MGLGNKQRPTNDLSLCALGPIFFPVTFKWPLISNATDGFDFPIPNLLFELSHIKFDDCKIEVEPLPINICLLFNVVIPIPPRVIDNVPDDILEAFKLVNAAPEPEKVLTETDVIEQLVPVKFPVNCPPVKGKNKDNTEVIGVPFLYISLQFIFP